MVIHIQQFLLEVFHVIQDCISTEAHIIQIPNQQKHYIINNLVNFLGMLQHQILIE